MALHAKGTFDVKMSPLPPYDSATDTTLGRFGLDKRYEGDLVASAIGEMLSAGSTVKNSAGYVAVERVTGALGGRQGSFALQHLGVMERGAGRLAITVVPDSGTLEISVADKKHFYAFTYTLP